MTTFDIERATSWMEHQTAHQRSDIYVLQNRYGHIWGKLNANPLINPEEMDEPWTRILGRSKGFIDWGYLWFSCDQINSSEIIRGYRDIKISTSQIVLERTISRIRLLYVAVNAKGYFGTLGMPVCS